MCQWQQPADAEMYLNQLNCYTLPLPSIWTQTWCILGHPMENLYIKTLGKKHLCFGKSSKRKLDRAGIKFEKSEGNKFGTKICYKQAFSPLSTPGS